MTEHRKCACHHPDAQTCADLRYTPYEPTVPRGYYEVDMPDPMPSLRGDPETAWSDGKTLVICGSPEMDDEDHDCDALGCRQDHVLWRGPVLP